MENQGLPWWLSGKESACNAGDIGFHPCWGKIPWRTKWQSTLVFLPAKSHEQRYLAGYNPWGCKRVRYNLATKSSTTIENQMKQLSKIVLEEMILLARRRIWGGDVSVTYIKKKTKPRKKKQNNGCRNMKIQQNMHRTIACPLLLYWEVLIVFRPKVSMQCEVWKMPWTVSLTCHVAERWQLTSPHFCSWFETFDQWPHP